jgi:hypothetical protein
MGSFGGGGQKTSQSSAPPAYALPHLQRVQEEAGKVYSESAPEYYSGSTVANLNADQLAAQQSLRDAAGGLGSFLAPSTSAYQSALNAPDLANNPIVGQISEGITNPIFRQLGENILPGLRGGAQEAGQYGGTRQGIAEGLAVRGSSEVASEAVSRALQGLYATGTQARTSALQATPELASLQGLGAKFLDLSGQQQYQQEQAKLSDEVARHDFEQNISRNRLIDYANILQGTTFGGEGQSRTSGGSGGLGSAISGIGTIAKLFA